MSNKRLRKPKKRKQKETSNSKRLNLHSELKVEYFNAFPLLYQLGGVFMIAMGLYILPDAFKNPYLDIGLLSISLIFIFFAAACFYPLFKKRLYIFSSTKQQILLKKQGNTFIYPFEDVLGYCEYDQTYRDFGSEGLLIETRTKTFNIPLKDYRGYFHLKEFVKANFKQLDQTLYTSYYLKSILPYAIFIIAFISAGLWSEIDNNSLDLETTVITLADKPKFVRGTGKSKNHHWKFKSEEYPAFIFKYSQRKAKVDLGKLSRNDKLNIMIAKDILEMKLLKIKKPTFRMKHFGWESIWVKGLKLEH